MAIKLSRESVGLKHQRVGFDSRIATILVVSSKWKDRGFLLLKSGFDSLYGYRNG